MSDGRTPADKLQQRPRLCIALRGNKAAVEWPIRPVIITMHTTAVSSDESCLISSPRITATKRRRWDLCTIRSLTRTPTRTAAAAAVPGYRHASCWWREQRRLSTPRPPRPCITVSRVFGADCAEPPARTADNNRSHYMRTSALLSK